MIVLYKSVRTTPMDSGIKLMYENLFLFYTSQYFIFSLLFIIFKCAGNEFQNSLNNNNFDACLRSGIRIRYLSKALDQVELKLK